VPNIHALAELFRLARHVDALALRVIEPTVIAATQALLFDPAPLERGTAVRAMRLERPDAPLLVTEDDELLAEQLHFLRQIAQLIRGADRLPIPAQQLTHRAPQFDAGQLIVRRQCLPFVRRFHYSLPMVIAPCGMGVEE